MNDDDDYDDDNIYASHGYEDDDADIDLDVDGDGDGGDDADDEDGINKKNYDIHYICFLRDLRVSPAVTRLTVYRRFAVLVLGVGCVEFSYSKRRFSSCRNGRVDFGRPLALFGVH